jgi:DNA topoisomerase-1
MGEEFTPKDFRTWAGTLIAAVKLAELGVTEDLDQAEENVLAAVDDVAKRLGNTKDIARASYISPRVIDHYMEGSVIAYYGELVEEVIAAEQGGLTEGEEELLKLLRKKLLRELSRAA